jgi:hypothetical protein
MKIIVCLFLFILFLPQVSFSQTDAQKDSSIESYNHEIQFYIVNEIIAAYKYKFDDNSSLRLILNATGMFTNQDADEIEYYELIADTLVGTEKTEITYSNHFFELKLQYLYNTKLHRIVQLYFGGGPFVNYNFEQNESTREINSERYQEIQKSYGKSNSNIWNVGLSAAVGLELIIYENINVFAEYEAIVQTGWRSTDQYSSSNNSYIRNNDYDQFGYYLKGIRIGLGICF